jgi:hypothetical protein
MKLNKKQTKELNDKGYDVMDNKRIVRVYPCDGAIYGELIKDFGLTADEEFDCVALVVVATKEI